MLLSELLPQIQRLPRADKFRVLQFVASELSSGEAVSLVPDGVYPVWTPLGEETAAAGLLDFLDRPEGAPA